MNNILNKYSLNILFNSSAIAIENYNRSKKNFIGIELNEEYIQRVINLRFNK